MYIHCYIFIFIDFFVDNLVVLMSNRQKKRGRPCNIEPVVRILLRKSVFLVWQEKKGEMVMAGNLIAYSPSIFSIAVSMRSILIAENDRRWMAF